MNTIRIHKSILFSLRSHHTVSLEITWKVENKPTNLILAITTYKSPRRTKSPINPPRLLSPITSNPFTLLHLMIILYLPHLLSKSAVCIPKSNIAYPIHSNPFIFSPARSALPRWVCSPHALKPTIAVPPINIHQIPLVKTANHSTRWRHFYQICKHSRPTLDF